MARGRKVKQGSKRESERERDRQTNRESVRQAGRHTEDVKHNSLVVGLF